MSQKPKKIFFVDLDGTLLSSKQTVLPETREAINKWLEAGNYFAISSGRPLLSVKEVITQNNLYHPNIFAIAFNGSLIYNVSENKTVLKKTLSLEDVSKISSLAKKNNIYCHTYDDENILVPKMGEEIKFYLQYIHIPPKLLPNFPEGLKEEPCKCICVDINPSGKLEKFAEILEKELPGKITCVKSSDYYLEVFNSNSGKGKAVEDLCKILNVDIKNTFAAGDQMNDFSMIEKAANGIAMKNGTEELRKIAKFITEEDNDHNGLIPFFINNL